jgi:dihydrolipoamide dehydrogenase
MPSKEVLSAAAHRFQARHDHRLAGDPPSIDLPTVVETKDEHVSNFAAHRRTAVHDMTDRDGVRFLHGTARFVDDRTLAVSPVDGDWDGHGDDPGREDDRSRADGGVGETAAAAGAAPRSRERRLDVDYVVLATGSSPRVPDLPGLDEVPFSTSADVLDATELPDSGVVMGFGYVGLELVPYLVEAGVDVTAIEHDERPLDEADPAFGDELLSIYREEFGVDVRTEVFEERVEPVDGSALDRDTDADEGVRLHLDDGSSVTAEELFVFTGREPALDRLDLDAAGLSPGRGWVDDAMRAVDDDDDRIYVVGDANGKEPILHVAKEHGFLAGENLLADVRGEPVVEYDNTHHHVVFSGATVYPYARVGHSAASAAEAGRDDVVVTRRAESDGVFKTKDADRGLASLVVAADGTVLGYQGLHYHADVMAKTMQVVVETGMDVRDVPDRAYHPTTPEIVDGLVRDAVDELGE